MIQTKSIPEKNPTPVQQEQTSQEDLNINDLNALRQIIEITNSRGSFKAMEMEAVGRVYNKLAKFLDQASSNKGQEND
ncbi:MAG: hypothetical protein EBT86_11575 [Actinobacteria bacterium]|nr:hypothetical protein [Actinomycetota bacterium]NDC04148.1 hypothetical protein [Betaproteobacteria bacterium]NDC86838.1 hypothetical protein [Betaproteobacteria bacterium]